MRMSEVVRGCFRMLSKNEEYNLFASTPSLVTARLLLCMAMARNWGITLSDVSTCLLHAEMSGEVFVWPPMKLYPVKKHCTGFDRRPNFGRNISPRS